jgi:exodeoxyribonuclease-3
MRICSFNANGLRSAASKGFFDWFAGAGIDVLCVQETKAQEHQLADALFRPAGYHVAFRNLSVVSLYLPSGSSGEERQGFKFEVMRWFRPQLQALRASGRDVVVCGDWNIAHTPKDIRNAKSNEKNSGFLPEERAWLTALLEEDGWVDAYRRLRPEGQDYTWWSQRGQARAKNVGWRIDYQLVSPGLASRLKDCAIHPEPRFSDHAPFVVDYAD